MTEKWKNPFSTRPEAGTPLQIVVDRNFRRDEREQAKIKFEHFVSVADLHDYLESNGHRDACASVFSCDPWKYEHVLLNDLIGEHAKEKQANPERVNRLRKLIRAGSWMTHRRKNTREILDDFEMVRIAEERAQESRIRHADPDTSKELRQNLNEETKELDGVFRAIDQNATGQNAEDATRVIENLQARAWVSLKKLLAVRGIALDEAKHDPAAKHQIAEIERLRSVRDRLYYQRCYPEWARRIA